MAIIKGIFISPAIYNRLPYIYEVSDAPDTHSQDLKDLRALLAKHSVPSGVCVRLIHKHFEAGEGEIMAFKKVDIATYGTVVVMQPVSRPDAALLKPLNYFVNSDGDLQAYEYTCSDQVTNLSDYPTFVNEFCRLISERGLQRKFGLKLKSELEKVSFTEFEFPAERSTIMIPKGLPVPDVKYEISVRTDWTADLGKDGAPNIPEPNLNCAHCFHSYCPHCSHAYCDHCAHCAHWRNEKQSFGDGLYLGGRKLETGT